MNEPTYLHPGRRMHRIVSTELCCHGSCADNQGRGTCPVDCPRYTSPIKPQPVIGTAPFVWTGVILLVVAMASGIVYMAKVLAA